jgi:hypothetical protein
MGLTPLNNGCFFKNYSWKYVRRALTKNGIIFWDRLDVRLKLFRQLISIYFNYLLLGFGQILSLAGH